MLKITDKPQYEDYENTMEVMDMFKHAIHSDFALKWISGALARINVERSSRRAYRKAIEIWFADSPEQFEEFMKLFKSALTLTTLLEMHDTMERSETND